MATRCCTRLLDDSSEICYSNKSVLAHRTIVRRVMTDRQQTWSWPRPPSKLERKDKLTGLSNAVKQGAVRTSASYHNCYSHFAPLLTLHRTVQHGILFSSNASAQQEDSNVRAEMQDVHGQGKLHRKICDSVRASQT